MEELYEILKINVVFGYIFLVLVPVAVALTPHKLPSVQELKVYRMHHYDLHGNRYGSRRWRFSLEATSLRARDLTRKCLVVWWNELKPDMLDSEVKKSLGAVIIIIPRNLSAISNEDQEAFIFMEERLSAKEIDLPVYVAFATPEIEQMLDSVQRQNQAEEGSVLKASFLSVTANSYKLVSQNQASNINSYVQMQNVVAKLTTFDRSDHSPNIVIVAHYDTFGLSPLLSYGVNSNASGVIILLELLRIFSKLYKTIRTSPKCNLIFLLSAGGKLNYQGTRQWLDNYFERYDSHGNGESKIQYALCLDSLARGRDLYMHVSKMPKNQSHLSNFHQHLVEAAQLFNRSIGIVQKKINLADDFLAWEHERFNIRKIYATTLSSSKAHKDATSRSILDLNTPEYVHFLSENTRIIAEALFRHLFDMSNLGADRFIRDDEVQMWLDYFSRTPRSAQLFVNPQDSSFLNDMTSFMQRFASEVTSMSVTADKKDPEFVLFEAVDDVIFAYSTDTNDITRHMCLLFLFCLGTICFIHHSLRLKFTPNDFRIKPALFDLVLALVVAGYVFAVYFAIVNVSVVQQRVHQLVVYGHEKVR